MARLPGPAIVGLADVFVGLPPVKKPVVLVQPRPGANLTPNTTATTAKAAAPARAVPIRTAAGGRNKEGHGHAKAAAFNALKAGDKAVAAANKAAKAVKQYTGAVKLGCHSPVVPVAVAGVSDSGQVVLGADVKKPLTPTQQRALQRQTAAIAKTAAATRRLGALAQRAQQAGLAAHQVSKQTTSAIAQSLRPKWKAKIGVADLEFLGAYYDQVAPPNPHRPGFLTDGSLDPIILLGESSPPDPNAPPSTEQEEAPVDTSQDVGEGVVTAPDGTVLYDPSADPEIVPMPQRGATLSADDAQISWQHVPEDGIPYDGSRGLPVNSVGSWNVFYGGTKNGDGWGIPGFLRGTPDNNRTIQWMFNAPDLGHQNFAVAPQQYQSTATSGAPDATAVSDNSLNRGWGAIVGNPTGPLANLQYAVADKVWFWQGATAPVWATTETDAKIAAANKKIMAANRAAALVQLAQIQKDQAAQAEAKAKQDAANALALSAADTQSQIAQKQVEAQKAQLDVQQQKAELQAQQTEAELAAQQQKVEAQAQHALVTQADIWNKWAAENPAEAVAQMQQGLQPGGDNYGAGYDFGDDEGGGNGDNGGDDPEDD